jgi:general stress protein 26
MGPFEEERVTPYFETIKEEVNQILKENKEITLATSYKDRVTARTVSFVNKDLEIYFLTWQHNKKITQISHNPNVALTVLNVQMEGVAEVLGKPGNYQEIGDLFRAKFSDRWFETFSGIEEMVLVKVEMNRVVKFENINRRFHLQNLDLINKIVHQMRIEDKTNPHYPY